MIQIGIAGFGKMGHIRANEILKNQDTELIAIFEQSGEIAQKEYEKTIFCKSYEELLEQDIDAVFICAFNNIAAEYTIKALQKGLHVFCEKPLDLSLERVVEVLDIVNKAGVKLMLGFNRRFDKEFRKVKDLVKTGAVGQPHLVKITSRDPGAPPISYIEKSGGLFLDMTIHDFDVARFVVDKEVEEVYAKGAVLIDEAIGRSGDIDTAVVTLTYSDGTMAVIDNSREASYGYDQRVEVFGSKGMVQSNNNFMDSHKLYNDKGIHAALPLHFFLERYREAYKNET